MHKNDERTAADIFCLQQVTEYIQKSFHEKIGVADLAHAGKISKRECYRLFKRLMGISPSLYVTKYRLQRAQVMLRETEKSVTEIAMECGFGSSSYFAKVFRSANGMAPREYRRTVGNKSI